MKVTTTMMTMSVVVMLVMMVNDGSVRSDGGANVVVGVVIVLIDNCYAYLLLHLISTSIISLFPYLLLFWPYFN